MAILLAFVVQAVAYEFRSKPNNFFGHKTYEAFLIINGALGTILVGAAVSTFFTGSAFSVDKMNLTNLLSPTISRWQGPAHGLEAVLNWRNVALGLTIFFLARILGTMYILNTVDDENIRTRGKKQILINAVPFLVFFLAWTGALLLAPGFAVNPDTGEVFMQPYKYWLNLIEMPVVFILLGIGVLFVVLGLLRCYFWFNKCYSRAIWPTSIGTVLTVFSVFLLAGFNNTAYYPSTYDLQNSLTIANSSSSKYTLVAMSYVSLLVPFVLAYIWYAWWSINRKQITVAEMSEDGHLY
jgi:cytochrome d ubiquinol oxidase subunit II